jgi:hypothetical protein
MYFDLYLGNDWEGLVLCLYDFFFFFMVVFLWLGCNVVVLKAQACKQRLPINCYGLISWALIWMFRLINCLKLVKWNLSFFFFFQKSETGSNVVELLVTVQANKSIKSLVISVISMGSSSITFPFICS